MNNKKVTIAIIGTGNRGLTCYGGYIAKHPEKAQVVAIAEPKDSYRKEAQEIHQIPNEYVFKDWKELLAKPKLADAIIIATTDRLHTEPVIAAAEKGYHILLEKPMAATAKECIQIVDAINKNQVGFCVCHVLRYAPFYKKIKEIIDSGQIGDICTIQHLEGVCWWHYSHSYVRGNSRNVASNSFMLLAKCCHDVDIIRWWIGQKCLNVSSFGHLKHFRKENKPLNATERCIDCPLSNNSCPYSAEKFYFNRLNNNGTGWPLSMVINPYTSEELNKALREGPYGRCVYNCDNDVVDHQIVSMEFDKKITASLTMTAFTPHGRQVRIMGTHGYIEGDEKSIKVLIYDSAGTEKWQNYNCSELAPDIVDGHGGGDTRMMRLFIAAVKDNNFQTIETDTESTLDSHLIVFAAEKARLEKRVVSMKEMYANPE